MHALDKQQLNRAESGAHVQRARALCVPGPLLVEVTSSTCRALEFEFGIGIGPAVGQLIAPHVSATSLRKARSRNLLGVFRPLLQLIEQPLLFTHQRNQKMPRAHGAESTDPLQFYLQTAPILCTRKFKLMPNDIRTLICLRCLHIVVIASVQQIPKNGMSFLLFPGWICLEPSAS